ncbi:alpha/beta fold hydrolase [Candidatus Enterococcus ikei]|uniref:Alpha/beta hydrolase n=1 Tax=Candidatus Enterococcus ikei TaxID=2815326 RepID=A0ABS3GWR5_9ENTE|nr:alpha/beta hydrolase [Enterococcus sp. DIV0869a]MBO0439630.1 alpha/beta hydrolase [Enterococcus sp. DIV0869a]
MTKQLKTKSLGVRLLKGLGKVIFGIITILIVSLMITFTIHQISLKSEAKRIEPYGEKLEVFDGEMNVVDEGEGKKTILLLPGQGTASPYLDFKPMIDELKKEYRVVTIEPFGYGLSSQTNRRRSVENIVEEIHQVAKELNISKYTLMGHSIAGLYAVNYAQVYPNEMEGFIGIDSSTPEQPWPGIDMSVFDFLKTAGVFRALIKVNPEKGIGVSQDNPDFEQIKLLTMKNMSSPAMKDELQELSNSFPDSRGLIYPKNMPVLLFVADNDMNQKNWLEMHQDQLKGLDKGKLIQLTGAHYLHHTQMETIVKETTNFLGN